MTLRFSSRTNWDIAESDFAAAVRSARVTSEATGKPLIDLTVTNPTVCGFTYDAEAILAPLASPGAMVYDPDPRGMRSAREAVARYYADHGAEVDPNALVLTTSTSEAYGYLFRLLCNPGDEVMVATSSYPLFEFLADLQDVRLTPYPLFYDFGWWIDFAELERRIGPRTRAILVVHPNNPTGHWTSKQERHKLLELCEKYDLALIVDEVFLDYPLNSSAEAETFATGDHPVLTFVLSGMSKIVGLPQMKAAWVLTLGPADLLREALGRLEVIADTFLSMNAPVQQALAQWLASRNSIQQEIRLRATTNLHLAAANLPVLRTDAGWSAVVRSSLRAEELLHDRAVVVHSGAFYGIAERNRIVISLLAAEDTFASGIHRLAQDR